ncbi:MAG: biopolymer transporter ExbD [Planctomycetia bacterium]|nr:biopolymer transporter ExbD [Planctomycetia bacterium]
MKTPQRGRSRSIGFNMTPMIDVVFLLIIFFLVASHFSRQEASVEVALPKAEHGEPAQDDDTPRLTLSLPEEGKMFIGSREIRPNELPALLASEKNRAGRGLQLRIRGDKKIPYRVIQPILIDAAKAGVYDIQFAVVP